MYRFSRRYGKLIEPLLNKEGEVAFYKMLLKFQKRHPVFDAKKVMHRLYPLFIFE
jgi:hypothetical protein